MAQYIVNIDAWVTVEASTATEAWEWAVTTYSDQVGRIVDSAPLGGGVSFAEPEEQEEGN